MIKHLIATVILLVTFTAGYAQAPPKPPAQCQGSAIPSKGEVSSACAQALPRALLACTQQIFRGVQGAATKEQIQSCQSIGTLIKKCQCSLYVVSTAEQGIFKGPFDKITGAKQ